MIRTLTLVISAVMLSCVAALAGAQTTPPEREWTVMIFMNAKNNLECDALDNFDQLTSIDTGAAVQVVVELGRPAKHYPCGAGNQEWSGVSRFVMRRGIRPQPEFAVAESSVPRVRQDDMGSAETLVRFVEWSQKRFPAKRSALIIWNHGQGWRLQALRDRALRSGPNRADSDPDLLQRAFAGTDSESAVGGFRSVSFDEDTRNFLYNRDIQDQLGRYLGPRRLDLIGFDACLMATIETAYAMRTVASVMVASEELEPGAGWDYEDWLTRLSASASTIDAAALGTILVKSYERTYGDRLMTTLSAMSLDRVAEVSSAITALAVHLKSVLPRERANIAAARAATLNYGERAGLHNIVDIGKFVEELRPRTRDQALWSAIDVLLGHLRDDRFVTSSYASRRSKAGHGSHGVSIYFPATKANFDRDKPDNLGYLRRNTVAPVEFVNQEEWAPFISEYLRLVP